MTAIINDLAEGSFEDLPTPLACPAADSTPPVLTVSVNDEAVLTIARRLHDGACLYGRLCELRDFHALDNYETDIRGMLTAMVQSSAEAESPEISPCRNTAERRWFQGKWRCTACRGGLRFSAGNGWIHIRTAGQC
jgi:hypothetical protein